MEKIRIPTKIPNVGDVITTNYRPADVPGYEVIDAEKYPDGWYFSLHYLNDESRGLYFIGPYNFLDGRLLGPWCAFGTAGRESQSDAPPWNGIGFDEVGLIQEAPQMRMFDE